MKSSEAERFCTFDLDRLERGRYPQLAAFPGTARQPAQDARLRRPIVRNRRDSV